MRAHIDHLRVRQDGNALVTALLVLTLLLIMGFSTLAFVDTQQSESRKQRERESSFNLSEAVLSSQIFQLSYRWPGESDKPYPASCTQVGGEDCPNAASLAQGMNTADYTTGTQWTSHVRDNGGTSPTFYEDSVLTTQPSYDANDDGFVWVRAQALVRGKRRTLVALVKAEEVTLSFPKVALQAGHFKTSNNGNKDIMNNGGGDIVVRCDSAGNGCADYRDGQLNPGPVQYKPTQANAISEEALEQLRVRAASYGNYFATCPTNLSLAGDKPGEIVFVESGNCTVSANGVFNTAAKPGIYVQAKGTLTISGNPTYYGLIYHANTDDSTGYVFQNTGCAKIYGAVVIDGKGGADIGSCADNLSFDPNVFNNLKTFGTAGVVQNTFREIQASS